MTNGGMTMEVNLHVEDPGAFTTPWDAIPSLSPSGARRRHVKGAFNALSSTSAAGPILESSCAEIPIRCSAPEGALAHSTDGQTRFLTWR